MVGRLKKFVGRTDSYNCVTVLTRNCLATHFHDEHRKWRIEDIKNVHLETDNVEREVLKCKVIYCNISVDVCLLFSAVAVEAPSLANPRAGGRYILIGYSARSEGSTKPHLVSDGMVVCEDCDVYGHFRGSQSSVVGDSSGDVFSYAGDSSGGVFSYARALIGIHVGNDLVDTQKENVEGSRQQVRSHIAPAISLKYLLLSAMEVEKTLGWEERVGSVELPPLAQLMGQVTETDKALSVC